MKKDKIISSMKHNAYYIVVLVGILALAALMIVYNIETRNKRELAEQHIDLNKPINEVKEEESVYETIGGAENKTKNDKNALDNVVEMDAPVEEVPASAPVEVAKPDPVPAESQKTDSKATANTVSGYDGKSKLEWPLVGNVILPYSMDTTVYFQTLDQYKCNPGILIQAAEGADVSSIFSGKITKVAEDGEKGKNITIDIGNNYVVEYGQLNDVKVKKGDVIETGSILGKVAAPTAFYTKEGTHLYFAVTKKEKPVDPMTILK